MPVTMLADFLNELDPPLGFKDHRMTIYDLLRVVRQYHIRYDKGRVHFAHLLFALSSFIEGIDLVSEAP